MLSRLMDVNCTAAGDSVDLGSGWRHLRPRRVPEAHTPTHPEASGRFVHLIEISGPCLAGDAADRVDDAAATFAMPLQMRVAVLD